MEIKGKTTSLLRLTVCVVIAFAVFSVFTLDTSFGVAKFNKTKVTGLKVATAGHNTAQVSWKKQSGASGYMVYVSQKKNGKYKKKATVSAKKLQVKVSGMTAGKTFYVKVRAYQKKGGKKKYGKYSKVVAFTGPPSLTVLAVKETTSKMKISISASYKAAGYELYRAAPGGLYVRIATLPPSKRTFIDSGLQEGKSYRYKVRAWSKVKKKKVYTGFSLVDRDVTGGRSKQYDLDRVARQANKLNGKKIAFLGSSVTRGYSSGGISFVEYLAKKDGVSAGKYAVDGTPISFIEEGDGSYCDRLEKIPATTGWNLLVCQLSSNDSRYRVQQQIKMMAAEAEESGLTVQEEAGQGKTQQKASLAELRENALRPEQEPLDKLENGLMYITAYSNERLRCPVVFYTLLPFNDTSSFEAQYYSSMVDRLYKVKTWASEQGYRVYILDMWNNSAYASFRNYNEVRSFYMADSVHPLRSGYLDKYTPAFENFLLKTVFR